MRHTRPGLSALAGQIIGYRKDGRPIRLIAGGAEDDPGTGETDGGTNGDDRGDKPDTATGTKKPKLDGDYDPDRALDALGKAREDARREKEARKAAEQAQQEKLDAVLVALGLKPDPKTDPAATAAKVAKELGDAQARLTELTIENALYKLAGKAGADVDALTDSRTFMVQLAELDPAAADFEKSVSAAIREAIKANPKLAAAPLTGQGPARQGADHGGGGNGRQRPASLGAALTARLSGQ